jgi:hypothetical protein
MTAEGSDTTIAEQIVSVLKFPALRLRSIADTTISYTVRDTSLKLRSVILDRGALRRLLLDSDRAVKVEYLKRDLLRSAKLFRVYRYPRRGASFSAWTTAASIAESDSSRGE